MISELPRWIQYAIGMSSVLGLFLGLIANIRLDDIDRQLKELRNRH
jgi:hypothetical protein